MSRTTPAKEPNPTQPPPTTRVHKLKEAMDIEQIAAAERADRVRRIIAYKQRHEKFKKIVYAFTSIATSFINGYLAYFVITQTMEASRGFNNYPSGVGRYILAAFFVISFLCCAGFGTIFCSTIFILGIDDDFGDHSSPRKKRPCLHPALIAATAMCLFVLPATVIPGRNLKQSGRQMEYYSKFDYHGPMRISACGVHEHHKLACREHPMTKCDYHKGVLVVYWNTVNITTGRPMECRSFVYDNACSSDVCMYDHDAKKQYRCPSRPELYNESKLKINQCMKERYNLSTCEDNMYDLDVTPELYGSSVSCEAEAEGVPAKFEYYRKSYEAGEIMLNIALAVGCVALAIIFTGCFVCIYELSLVSDAVLPIEDAIDLDSDRDDAVRNVEGTFV